MSGGRLIEMDLRYRRHVLATGDNFDYAVAMFPVRVVQMANDLRELLETKRMWSDKDHPARAEAIRYLSEKIQQEYLEMFGVPMGRSHAESDAKDQ
jgi:hypothetical protein